MIKWNMEKDIYTKLYKKLQKEVDKVIRLRENAYQRIKTLDFWTKILEIYYSVFTALLSVIGVKIGGDFLAIPSACFTVTVAILVCFFNSQGFSRRAHDLEANLMDLKIFKKNLELEKEKCEEAKYKKACQEFYKKQGDSEYPSLLDEWKENKYQKWKKTVIAIYFLLGIAIILPIVYSIALWNMNMAKAKMSNSYMIGGRITLSTEIISALISAVISLVITTVGWKYETRKQEKHAASMLYYDFLSIENYLEDEDNLVNIRFSDEWQSMVSDCSFLKSDDVRMIYKIYDLVYDYNYHYKRLEQSGTINKEKISQYTELKELIIGEANEKYENIKQYLKSHMKKN